MELRVKQLILKHYVPALLFLFGVLCIWFVWSGHNNSDLPFFLTSAGSLISFFYFIQKQKLDELQAFMTLFKDFNRRYDELNESLNKIAASDLATPLTTAEKDALNDYFNLCGEEYLVFSQGFIYPEVWQSWRNGMKTYLASEKIRKMWEVEERTGSYYGLSTQVIPG